MKFMQIGSHKGYDDFTEILKKFNPEQVELIILIEPNNEFNAHLKDCYSDYNFIIENVVINNVCEYETVKFYSCRKDMYPDKDGSNFSELSSLSKSHLIKHGVDYNGIEENEIPCYTINSMLNKYNIHELDYLFIDAEGHDLELIESIDLENFNIKKIFYENLHIDNERMISFLNSKNYSVNKNTLMNGWSSEATKIKI